MDYKFIASPNFDLVEEKRHINSIIIHYTGMNSSEEALHRLCDKEAKVSSHYFIDLNGSVFQLVNDNNIAWHSGASNFNNFERFNQNSIGIEIVNPGHDHGYIEFTMAQYDCLISLCLEIIKKYPITPKLILGHSDVSPQRKIDPGEKFNWYLLHSAGIGLMPPKDLLCLNPKVLAKKDDFNDPTLNMQKDLRLFGYDINVSGVFDELSKNVVRAFHSHYYQDNIDCLWDENSEKIIKWLCTQS